MVIKKQNQAKYMWDLSDVFQTQEDFDKALKKCKNLVKKISFLKGQIKKANDETFLKFIDLETKLNKLNSKLAIYASWFHANMNDKQKMHNWGAYKQLSEFVTPHLAWIPGELRELGEKKVLAYVENSKKYAYLSDKYKNYFRLEKYHLKKNEEEFLANFIHSLTAYDDLYSDLVVADYKYPTIEMDGRKQVVNQTYASKVLTQSHPRDDQKLRLTVLQERLRQYYEKATTLAEIYNGRLSTSTTLARLQGYKSALHAGLWADNVPIELYTNFIKIAYDHKYLVYDYIKLHRTIMKTKGIKKYHISDNRLFLEMPSKKEMEVTVEDAIKIIKKATSFLGPEYAEALDKTLAPGKIDYYEREGKSPGGFMMSQPATPSYILMNWTNDIQALLILAHEAGHGVHSYLASKTQKFEYADYPVLTAEVASTFIEFIVIFYLLNQKPSKEKRIYLTQSILSSFITLYFATAVESNFEWKTRELSFNNQQIDKEVLAKINKEVLLFDDVYDKPNKDFYVINSYYTWSRLPHHFSTVFYLYKYALTTVVTCKLLETYWETGEAKGYLDLLKLGGRYLPLKLIKQATGIDLLDTKNHDSLFNIFTKVLKDFKDQLNVQDTSII